MGVFSFLRDLLRFYAKDRLSILLFLIAIAGFSFFIHQPRDNPAPYAEDITSEVRAELELIDSLRTQKAKPSLYKFNPNFLSEYNAYIWGVSDSALSALEAFRARGNWLYSAQDFQRITGVSDSLLQAMSPYFKFPSWTQNRIPSRAFQKKYPSVKKDLNEATPEELQEVYGIGPVISQRIIAFKERYGDFADSIQLRGIYGLKPETRKELFLHFEIKNVRPISQLDINTASASDLSTLPGIGFDLAKEIVILRRLHGRINSPEELLKIEGLNSERLAGIAVYLQFE